MNIDERRSTPRVALITGAAGGLGSAFARRLAGDGFHLIVTDKNQQGLEILGAELERLHGVPVETMVADLSDPAEIGRLANRITDVEDLELLINNAGFATTGKFSESDPTKQRAMIQVHVLATVALTRAALPRMIGRRRGSIINVSSLAAFVPLFGGVTYGASKAFLVFFSDCLRYELRGSGVRALALCPGLMHSGFHETEEFENVDLAAIPRALWSDPDEVVRKSLRALERGKALCLPGFINRLLKLLFSNFLVRRLLYWLARR